MSIVSPAPVRVPPPRVWNLPNILTSARLGLAIVLFVLISQHAWLTALAVFIVAAITDWLDGYLARKQGLTTPFGRNFDPLVDKVLVCGTFIFLLPEPAAGLVPWMVTLIVARELIVTGLRSFFEAHSRSFGADWLGKLKMVLQCAAIIAILLELALAASQSSSLLSIRSAVRFTLVWAMLIATALSGAQYLWRAVHLFKSL
jgi:CDP-diacylglycerol--glycerol-3-phosphate 3-phosphatidyltransferase